MIVFGTARKGIDIATGIETARQMALTAAVTIEVREDAGAVRQQAVLSVAYPATAP